jgi:hypothetical protein
VPIKAILQMSSGIGFVEDYIVDIRQQPSQLETMHFR